MSRDRQNYEWIINMECTNYYNKSISKVLHRHRRTNDQNLSLSEGDLRRNGALVGLWRTQQECFRRKGQKSERKHPRKQKAAMLVRTEGESDLGEHRTGSHRKRGSRKRQ